MTIMLDKNFAEDFAADWVAAWNAHDLDRVLTHYADEFEMSSPYISQMCDEPSGRLTGKDRVRVYWAKALQLLPDLYFELLGLFTSVDSIALYYRSARGPTVEMFNFNKDGKVAKAYAHYPSKG